MKVKAHWTLQMNNYVYCVPMANDGNYTSNKKIQRMNLCKQSKAVMHHEFIVVYVCVCVGEQMDGNSS